MENDVGEIFELAKIERTKFILVNTEIGTIAERIKILEESGVEESMITPWKEKLDELEEEREKTNNRLKEFEFSVIKSIAKEEIGEKGD